MIIPNINDLVLEHDEESGIEMISSHFFGIPKDLSHRRTFQSNASKLPSADSFSNRVPLEVIC